MLQELLSAISRSVSTTPAVNPYGGGSNIPMASVFGKMFNNLVGSFTGGPANVANPMQGFNGQMQTANPAAQAYANSLANGQNFFGAAQPQTAQREAFSPGSVINTLQMPPAPQAMQDPYSQIGQLANATNPLQGFAGQAGAVGATTTGAYGASGFALPGQFVPGPGLSPNGIGGLGKLSTILMPFIGLLGFVKSLFGLRGMGLMQPVRIDKEALDYKVALQNYDKTEHTDGSFDDDYWGESNVEREESEFDTSKLEM